MDRQMTNKVIDKLSAKTMLRKNVIRIIAIHVHIKQIYMNILRSGLIVLYKKKLEKVQFFVMMKIHSMKSE